MLSKLELPTFGWGKAVEMVWTSCLAAVLAFALTIIIGISGVAAHELHGVNYNNWTNNKKESCCNNQDCKPISDENVQYSPDVRVRVEGTWCKVHPHHYLEKGNAPDWSTAHVCVRVGGTDESGYVAPVCDRLLCFQPKPLF